MMENDAKVACIIEDVSKCVLDLCFISRILACEPHDIYDDAGSEE